MGRKNVKTRVKTRTLNVTLEEAGRLINVLWCRHMFAAQRHDYMPTIVARQMIYRVVAASQGIDIARAKQEIKALNKRRGRNWG